MACIEAEQECSSALTGILFDLVSGLNDRLEYVVVVWIVAAYDLVLAEAILLDSWLKLCSPL